MAAVSNPQIVCETILLFAVAYPLWPAVALAGSPVVPWIYVGEAFSRSKMMNEERHDGNKRDRTGYFAGTN
ncbi:MAG: hypothetical protein ABI646_03405 [Acidobacteriota bacterium]